MRLKQSRALLSEIFKATTMGLLFIFPLIILALDYSIALLGINSLDMFFEKMSRVGSFFMLFHLVVRLSYFDYDQKTSRSGFPKHALLLPLPTWFLVFIPLTCTGLFVSIYAAFWFNFIVPLPLSLTSQIYMFVSIAIFMVWMNVIVWGLGQARILAMVILLSIIVLLAICILFTLTSITQTFGIEKTVVDFILFLLAFFGVTAAYVSVACSRNSIYFHGFNFFSMRSILNLCFSIFSQGRSKQNGVSSQFNYEWRAFGWLVPAQSCLVTAVHFIVQFIPTGNVEKISSSVIVIFTFAVILPLFAVNMAGSYIGLKNMAMTSFWATRPLSDCQLAHAKLKLVACSVLLSAIICIAPLYPAWVLGHSDELVRSIWATLVGHQGFLFSVIIVGCIILALIALSWSISANSLSFYLTGKNNLTRKFKIIREAIIVALFGFTFITYKSVILQNILLELFPMLLMTPFVLGLIFAYFLMERYRAIASINTLIKPFSIAFFVVFILFTFLLQLNLRSGDNLILLVLASTLAIFSVLPFMAAPIGISINRHR